MKTQEQKLQDTKNYLAKSAQHLFVANDKFITKIIPFEKDDKQYYAILKISEDYVGLSTFNAETMKWNAKNNIFPQYVKTKSIPYFKRMRELIKSIEGKIEVGHNKELIEQIKLDVKDLVLIKE